MEQDLNRDLYDVIVIGGGPAGLTAAIYLARARYRVLVIEKEQFGGQITITAEVVNYPGVERVSGEKLTKTMQKQAQWFGAEFLLADVLELSMEGDIKTVHTSRGEKRCFGVLLATGARPRMVGFQGEEEFRGHGVAYCATCDGEFFTGKEVFVVGGGFAAAEESIFLTKYATHVTVLIRSSDFKCARATAEAARSHPKITVLTDTQVDEVSGDSVLRYLRYRNTVTGEVTEYRASDGDYFGVFVFAGYEPATELVKDLVQLEDHGYVTTDSEQRTSVEGLYAAGDICVKSLRQVVTAVGDGALAATGLERLAAAMQQKTGLHPPVPEVSDNASRSGDTSGSHEAAGKDSSFTSGDSFGTGSSSGSGNTAGEETGAITSEMREQLHEVFSKMASPLTLKLYLDQRAVSGELKEYMEELTSLTDKLTLLDASGEAEEENPPCVRIFRADGSPTGLAFHGVPGGHEFTSFVLGLYYASGSGQALEPDLMEQIQAITQPVRMKVLVSLSCTMCPDLVKAAQRIAAQNSRITAEVFDLNHFQELQKKYQVMSVPALVINDGQVSFGKKDVRQLLEIISTV